MPGKLFSDDFGGRISATDVTDDMLRREMRHAEVEEEQTTVDLCRIALCDVFEGNRLSAKRQIASEINRRAGFVDAVMVRISMDDIQWIVNDLGELGVKIGENFAFLYKGYSYRGGKRWRPVGKREFGETCKPVPMGCNHRPDGIDDAGRYYVGEGWQDLPKFGGEE